MAKRRQFPTDVITKVLISSRRRCAMCYGLDGDATEKEGQIAHVDRDASNVALKNAAWLCTRHHPRYDSRSRQTRGHTPDELRSYRAMLYEHMASPSAWPDAGASRTRSGGVSLEVFERRVPFYRATIDFIRTAVREGKLGLEPIFKFASATDEALFLFDDELAEYLATLYRTAVRLHTVSVMKEPVDRRTPELEQEWADLLLWFTEQFEVARRRFAPHLRLGKRAG